jgi:hypothetical protein
MSKEKVISDKELNELLRKLEAIKYVFSDQDFQTVISDASEIALEAAKSAAPKSKRKHSIKSVGGGNEMVRPGNLKRSIQMFQAKKQKVKTVLVGPVLSKKAKLKSVKGAKRLTRRNRAYYATIVMAGHSMGSATIPPNRFIEKARTQSKSAVYSKLKEGAIKYAKKEIKDIFK